MDVNQTGEMVAMFRNSVYGGHFDLFPLEHANVIAQHLEDDIILFPNFEHFDIERLQAWIVATPERIEIADGMSVVDLFKTLGSIHDGRNVHVISASYEPDFVNSRALAEWGGKVKNNKVSSAPLTFSSFQKS